jgi:hypothetical protein
MKFCITKIHLGRYKIDMLDDNNQIVRGYDCGSAGVMVALTEWMFKDEALQYQHDQRRSSDELGDEAIIKMLNDKDLNPKGLIPISAKPYNGRTALARKGFHPLDLTMDEALTRIAEIDSMFESAIGWGSWMIEAANEREALANKFNLPHKYQARSGSGGRVD